MPASHEKFATWADVIAHVQAGCEVRYHAPLDILPSTVIATVRGKNPRKVRVVPLSNQADPFWADAGHLARFVRIVRSAP